MLIIYIENNMPNLFNLNNMPQSSKITISGSASGYQLRSNDGYTVFEIATTKQSILNRFNDIGEAFSSNLSVYDCREKIGYWKSS